MVCVLNLGLNLSGSHPLLGPTSRHSLHRPTRLETLQKGRHPVVCLLHVQLGLHWPRSQPHSLFFSTGAVHQHNPRLAGEAFSLVWDDGSGFPL